MVIFYVTFTLNNYGIFLQLMKYCQDHYL